MATSETRRTHTVASHRRNDVRETYARLVDAGLSPAQAANLTALASGLAPTDRGWTLRELGQLLFLRHLASTERVSG